MHLLLALNVLGGPYLPSGSIHKGNRVEYSAGVIESEYHHYLG